MKKIFLLIAVVLGFAATKVNAQQQNPIRFGVKAGVNLAEWQGETVNSAQNLIDLSDGSVSRKMREGFHVGGYVSIPLAPGFEIEPGLQYSQKGTRLTGKIPIEEIDFLNTNLTLTNKAEYLDLPVLAKVYVGEGFHIYGGPQVSYLLSNKVQAEAGALGFKALNKEWDVKNGFREIDFAVTGGVGYRFASGLNLSAGYDYGLSSIDSNNSFETYNRVVKASVGFTF
ncbi:porin family protein [uncultured Pontibacter sp.]|uniref:porin family protein n=1 Tax=uncultured Pontibacter sp. TaxID=453356 RepID=UPI00262846D0|nr:porin family protein [uncultured Pontibacter sp.]